MKGKCIMALLVLLPAMIHAAEKEYVEPVDTAAVETSDWDAWSGRATLTWTSKDVLFRQFAAPQVQAVVTDTVVSAWRGERIGVEALVVAPEATGELAVELSPLMRGGVPVAASGCSAAFMRYVITTAYNTCGYPDPDLPTYTVPDMIDLPSATASLPARSVRPVWCTVEVPRDIEPGVYEATLTVKYKDSGRAVGVLRLAVDVDSHTLPRPEDMAFYLDMWQQPYAISRYYGVEPWSREHFELLRPYSEQLARAGQKTVTTILFYEPWGEQSNDEFQPMVETVLMPDGSWQYDYTIFDRYVEFMADCGIDANISCFTMIPWEMKFRYFDKANNRYDYLSTTTSAPEYKALWTDFLQSLAAHLKEKGWYDKTLIVMDERALPDMLNAYGVAQVAVPGIKMSLAGNYHPELVDALECYTLIKGDFFPDDVLQRRRSNGYVSLMYTCCATSAPSIFSNSEPADAAYLPVYATATGFDGYLHWSFSNWTDEPLTDTRFHMFAPGDTYIVYPDGRTSIRYERLVEGVQMSEKLRILRKELLEQGNLSGLGVLEEALLPVRTGAMSGYYPTSKVVNRLQQSIEKLSRNSY